MTEINLTEDHHQQQQQPIPSLTNIPVNTASGVVPAQQTTISTSEGGNMIAGPQPPESELPSYNEAIRVKKMEAYTNDLPPSYFDPANEPGGASELRSTIEAVNVRFFFFLRNSFFLILFIHLFIRIFFA
jgi:hypothetical protein